MRKCTAPAATSKHGHDSEDGCDQVSLRTEILTSLSSSLVGGTTTDQDQDQASGALSNLEGSFALHAAQLKHSVSRMIPVGLFREINKTQRLYARFVNRSRCQPESQVNWNARTNDLLRHCTPA